MAPQKTYSKAKVGFTKSKLPCSSQKYDCSNQLIILDLQSNRPGLSNMKLFYISDIAFRSADEVDSVFAAAFSLQQCLVCLLKKLLYC